MTPPWVVQAGLRSVGPCCVQHAMNCTHRGGEYNAIVQITLRDFQDGDFEALWAIDQECFAPGVAYSKAELMHYVRRRNAFTIVAGVGAEIAGFVVGEVIRRRGHLITLDVLPRYRRDGVGSKLMGVAEERMRGAGCLAVFLETAVDNVSAIPFYKKHGYVVLKTIPRYYEGKLDALLMGKKLEDGTS